MAKQAPTLGRILAMIAFALSCFGLLLFLWLSFGGAVPLQPQGYRFEVAVAEAPTLPVEADVRLAGVSVGKVKSKRLERGARRTLLEVEVKPDFAPIPRNARVILRQKTLLGESYLEITPGRRSTGLLPDGGRLPDAQVEPTVELDEVFSAFDRGTRADFRLVARELSTALRGGRPEAVNDALGNLALAASDAQALLAVLDGERDSVRRLVRDGGVVFGALNERRGALRGLVEDGNAAFGAIASHDDALADAVAVLPTFLDELRTTVARLETTAVGARPLVRDLRESAGDLRPTLRDLAAVAPDLEGTFRDLGPLTSASRRGLPALGDVAREAGPVVEGLDVFLDELNPVVSTLGFYQSRVAGFLSNGGAALNYDFGGERGQGNVAAIDPRSFERFVERPEFDRGNAYLQPNAFNRVIALGAFESIDCSNAQGPRGRFGDVPQEDAVDVPEPLKTFSRRPACLVAPRSLLDGRIVTRPGRGEAPVERPPRGTDGTLPASAEERE